MPDAVYIAARKRADGEAAMRGSLTPLAELDIDEEGEDEDPPTHSQDGTLEDGEVAAAGRLLPPDLIVRLLTSFSIPSCKTEGVLPAQSPDIAQR